MSRISQIWKVKELRNKILIVAGLLVITRILAHIPIPGIGITNLRGLLASNQLLGLFDIFSGGGLRTFSVVMLGVGPYITASIVIQLLTIIIPKLGANAKVIADVDPFDSRVYQRALTKGVAHAKGSAYPGEIGNVFLFSHSSVNFYEAQRYNSIFYLLNKLEPGDEIRVYYQGQPIIYRVSETKIVSSSAVNYLQAGTGESSLTLMTCWPAGTTYKRLLVIARPVLR